MKEREPNKPERIEIKEMPDKHMLERFLEGMTGIVTVYFDIEQGKFVEKIPEDGGETINTNTSKK